MFLQGTFTIEQHVLDTKAATDVLLTLALEK
jgi:hypothetical protein